VPVYSCSALSGSLADTISRTMQPLRTCTAGILRQELLSGTSNLATRFASTLNQTPVRVVVVGSGYAGFACAKKLDPQHFDVTVVR
jgi:NADPH-dependent 2,4-dienoyl-CoA reductase/sulfur reductase-like enzyme